MHSGREDTVSRESYQARIAIVEKALKKRAMVHPLRDETFVQMNQVLEEFASYLINTTAFNGFSPDKAILAETKRFCNNPVFICGSMKSGTTLITQLFDNHPQLFVMPGDSHYIDHEKWWTRDQLTEISIYWLKRVITPFGREPFWFLGQERKTFEMFLQYLHYFLTHTQNDIFVCVVLAMYAANKNYAHVRQVKYWVEKTAGNELKVPMLYAKFPHAKFIHIIRNPLNNITSLKKLAQIRDVSTTPSKQAQYLKKLFQAAQQNLRTIGKEQYHIIKYEDLVSNPKEILTGICGFLNISFDETLLIPTENGRPGTSNSMYSESRVKGHILDQSKREKYQQELSTEELKDIVTILYPEAIAFGYDWNQKDILRYRRAFWQRKLHHYLPRIYKMWRLMVKRFRRKLYTIIKYLDK